MLPVPVAFKHFSLGNKMKYCIIFLLLILLLFLAIIYFQLLF